MQTRYWSPVPESRWIDNDEGKLVQVFHLFMEVLDFLRVIEVTLSANAFDFPRI